MANRRDVLTALVATATAAAVKPNLSFALDGTEATAAAPNKIIEKPKRKIPWRNWSGSQECFPKARKAPGDVSELQEIVANATGVVRPVGAGHSFMPLVPTDDTVVSLGRMSGLISANPANGQATILAGTRLGDIGGPLAEHGMAMINMPDIDKQSLAGALGTATHGTGATLGCLSSNVTELELVTATGDLLTCNEEKNSDIFNAARVNLGALGVVSQITLETQAAYRLRRETEWMPIEDILADVENLAENNRNFEFYYIPFSGMGFTDVHNITTDTESRTEELDQNSAAQTLMTVRDWLSWSPKLRELILSGYMSTVDKEVVVANSWENYTKERNVRFNEMEYHLPKANLVDAFKEVRNTIEKNFPEVFFPIEVRFVKSDDIWLSPFNGRDSCSIAIHRFFKEDYKALFAAIEPIFQKYGGRPHWGKLNTMNKLELSERYDNWSDFNEVRRQMDPNGKFLNPYLKALFT